jgi:hypothetical protein
MLELVCRGIHLMLSPHCALEPADDDKHEFRDAKAGALCRSSPDSLQRRLSDGPLPRFRVSHPCKSRVYALHVRLPVSTLQCGQIGRDARLASGRASARDIIAKVRMTQQRVPSPLNSCTARAPRAHHDSLPVCAVCPPFCLAYLCKFGSPSNAD